MFNLENMFEFGINDYVSMVLHFRSALLLLPTLEGSSSSKLPLMLSFLFISSTQPSFGRNHIAWISEARGLLPYPTI